MRNTKSTLAVVPLKGTAKQISEAIIHAPLNKVFVVAADLTRWPEFLPHYRYIRFLTHTPTGGIVKMCCVRRRILTTWISDFRIDTVKHELRLHHLRSTLNATLGIKIVWSFEELPDGSVRTRITHDLRKKRLLISRRVTDWVLGRFFIDDVAAKNLAGLKRKVEAQEPLPVIALPELTAPKLLDRPS